ncbi:hypothetical protein F4821DRAFT_280490 [Hypoxylon rubiginosum]|uniref:Uncharacterized protein n=1 Tax=Hypoxylon rubiginosum TaxID=110542 RepID=A0ACC0CUB5_9PEZI|nr:hypothetical protein F4821DRAFT_280490 [Hypoxylon rubiginosum]
MLTLALCNTVTFFYPMARPMDITCCDNQKAVIARNVLLFSLIIDDDDNKNESSIWCIYFHLYLNDNARTLLRLQAKKLLELSTTVDVWRQSKYGSRLGFCDSDTLKDVRKMWEFYSLEQEGEELSQFQRLFESTLQQAREFREARGFGPANTHPAVSGMRSVSPAVSGTADDFNRLCRHFWKHWSTELRSDVRAGAEHPNPMFLTSKDDARFYYGCNPLDGFHLITPYVSPDSGSQLLRLDSSMSRLRMMVEAAQKEFSQWASSYRKHSPNITVRFFVGEALPFAHTLQHRRKTGANTAGWNRSQHRPGRLVLDGLDYSSDHAPLIFDVIDTSTLLVDLGPVTLLTAASPLLRNSLTSTLYTGFNGKHPRDRFVLLDFTLCNPVPTMLALLGLFPIDYWTNIASFSHADEDLLNEPTCPTRELFVRTTWKRPVAMEGPLGPQAGLVKLRFSAKELARVLNSVYADMLYQEEVAIFGLGRQSLGIGEFLHKKYHRAAFASFVGFVKTRVECDDWDSAMNILLSLVKEREYKPMNMEQFQELIIYLHMFDIFSLEKTTQWSSQYEPGSLPIHITPPTTETGESWGELRQWKEIPPVVCVTLKVPREKLEELLHTTYFGAAPVHCRIGDANAAANGRLNLFRACQMAFGKVSTIGTRYSDSFELSITEDETGWRGSSALIVSFYVSSYSLLSQSRKAEIALAVVTGLELAPKIYETTLEDSANVYVTRYVPGQAKFPAIPGFAEADFTDPSVVNPGCKFFLSAGVSINKETKIESMTARFEITSPEYQSTLQNCEVQVSTESPYQIAVTLGQKIRLTAAFPVLVTKDSKTRIARKSCYIEVIVPTATAAAMEWTKHKNFMYPVHLVGGKLSNWNMPYLNLEHCPVIDRALITKLDWFVPHLKSSFSLREEETETHAEEARSFFKLILVTLFTEFGKSRVIDLCTENNRNRILIFPSDVRVDLANRTVVLDCAILPLHEELTTTLAEILPFEGVEVLHFCTSDHTVELYKHVLPACVERCRTWEHRDDCEYASSSKVPLSVEPDKPFLCTCGNGKFPADFITGLADWDELSKHAVRAAISPAFWAPYADEACRTSGGVNKELVLWKKDSWGGGPSGANTSTDGCTKCGKMKSSDGTELLLCSRCKKVKYCSHKCQKSDWKVHKVLCKNETNRQ